MTDELPYKDGNALWAAVTARAKTEAQNTGATAGGRTSRAREGFWSPIWSPDRIRPDPTKAVTGRSYL